MLGHSLAILMTTYGQYIPGTQDEALGFAVTCRALWRSLASAARVMDDILTPIPIDLRNLEKYGIGISACVTRRWTGRDENDLTENVRAQNQSFLAGRIPPIGCVRC